VDTSSRLHQPDDRLELYALGRLSDPQVEIVEEHLLICHSCVDRLEEIGVFALAAREDLKAHPEPTGNRGINWKAWLQPRFVFPSVFAMALLALGIFWTGGAPGRVLPVASLQLTAMRGEMQTVPAARETDLTLTDAPSAGGPFRVEVVDAGGTQVWSGTSLEIKIPKRLPPGDYFVRLTSAKGQLLHEYGFHVQ
jgi:hypothetical protein